MRKAQVIIGANYGDEGKGLLTDYFASQNPNSLIVRFNGGAQAGHTVVSPDGRRHVFSHFGSGSFLDAPTFLSKFFIVNPMLFTKELDELRSKNIQPEVLVDPRALVSTPFDVFINQSVELHRGGGRHGSCGVGINETVTRCLRSLHFCTRVKDLLDEDNLRNHLLDLSHKWLLPRLFEHQIDQNLEPVQSFLSQVEKIIERFISDTNAFLNAVTITKDCPADKQIIFEGAQGLMLDELRSDQFPHVTRSRTGLTNVIELIPQFDIDELGVTYVSRTYITRHGAGPLRGEEQFSFPDATNVPNPFQGHLRFARLDPGELSYSIERDLKNARTAFSRIDANLAFTCADQIPLPAQRSLPLPRSFISFGPTRADITETVLSKR